MKVAIMGMGVVGQAVRAASVNCELSAFDKYNQDRNLSVGQFYQTELCFVCVSTPTRSEGQNIGEVIDALRMLTTNDYAGVVCIKSTVLPGTMATLSAAFPKLRLVHNPEFLSEKTAVDDFANQDTVLLSGKSEDVAVVSQYFDENLKVRPVQVSSGSYETTEYAKYIHNCILAVKLSFLNEVHDLIEDQEVYDNAITMAQRFGNTGKHCMVPGPDGKKGWGGMCFVKDTSALASLAARLGFDVPTLRGAIQTNQKVRPEAYDGTEKTGLLKE